MTDQGTLFETPQERGAREYNEALAEYMEARRVESGYQCQDCGGIERNEFLFWNNHGLMGGRCLREHLRRNHALYALRAGEVDRWAKATADLRQIARWRAGR